MFLRKDRVHHTGRSNADLKAEGKGLLLNNLMISRPATSAGTPSALKKQTSYADINRKVPDFSNRRAHYLNRTNPKSLSEKYYQKEGRSIRGKDLNLTNQRAHQLEEDKIRKQVFTGDSLLSDKFVLFPGMESASLHYEDDVAVPINQYVPKTTSSQSLREEYMEKQRQKISMKKGDKQESHEKAHYETQLVSVEPGKSLEGVIDLMKLVKIRRTLRRKYAHRANFGKIFTTWDRSHKGYIQPPDVHYMLTKLGLNVTLNESRVLVASASTRHQERLHMDDFVQLMFGNNESLNVDLSRMSREYSEVPEYNENEIKNVLQAHLKEQHQEKLKKVFKQQLQNRIIQLIPRFQDNDRTKSGQLTSSQFKAAVMKLNLPSSVAAEPIIDSVFNEFKNPSGRLDYRLFTEQLQFGENVADDLAEEVSTVKTSNRPQSEFLPRRTSQQREQAEKLSIIDCKKAPENVVDLIHKRLDHVSRLLREAYRKNPTGFEKGVKSFAEKSEGVHDATHVHVTSLFNYFSQIFKESIHSKRVGKRELEGFLSAFTYTNDGYAYLPDVTDLVFTDDTTKQSFKLRDRKKRVAPDRNKLGSTVTTSFTEVDGNGETQKRAENILEELDRRLFAGSKIRNLRNFKDFDVDGDGYVSHKDFKDRLDRMDIQCSDSDANAVLKVLDPESSGFLDFKTFTERVRPNMVQETEVGEPRFLNYVSPNTNLIERNIKSAGHFERKRLEDKRRVDPRAPENGVLKVSGRFTHTPIPSNTLQSMRAEYGAPGYISENDRFGSSSSKTLDWQQEDNSRRVRAQSARIQRIQSRRSQIMTSVQSNEEQHFAKTEARLKIKALRHEEYEYKAHLQS